MLLSLLSLPRRILSLLLVAVFLAIFGAGNLVLSDPNGAALFAVFKPGHTFDVKPEELHRAARLSTEDRRTAVNECISRASGWIAVSRPRAGDETRAALIERGCDCFVNQIEDRGSKLQFAVAMDAIGTAPWSGGHRSVEGSTKYWSAARNGGMTPTEYKNALAETYTIMNVAARTCVNHLRGR